MNITVRQIEFKSTDGVNTVFGWIYIPAEPARGVVQISHGMAEHMGRYHDFMRYLAQNGYIACGIDHIGHGRSAGSGQYGYFGEQNGWSTLVDDQHKFHKIVCREVPDQQRFILLGHSMGSFVARLYAARYPQSLSGLVLSGTARGGVKVSIGLRAAEYSVKKNGGAHVDRSLNRLAFHGFNDHNKPTRTGFDWLSRDTEWVRGYIDDPQCGFVFTAAAFRDLFTLMHRANERACFAAVPHELPILLLSGLDDPVGEYGKGPARVCDEYSRAGVAAVELALFEGGRHEMLGESNRCEVWERALLWLNEQG